MLRIRAAARRIVAESVDSDYDAREEKKEGKSPARKGRDGVARKYTAHMVFRRYRGIAIARRRCNSYYPLFMKAGMYRAQGDTRLAFLVSTSD